MRAALEREAELCLGGQAGRVLFALERDAELGLGGQAGRVLFALARVAERGLEQTGLAHTHRP